MVVVWGRLMVKKIGLGIILFGRNGDFFVTLHLEFFKTISIMNTGWNFFFALLLAVIVGGVSSFAIKLEGWTPWWIGAIVFGIMVIFLTILSFTRKKNKKADEAMEVVDESRKE